MSTVATEQEWWQRLADGLGVPLEDDRLQVFDVIGAHIEGRRWNDGRARRRLGESLANSAVSAAVAGSLDDDLATASNVDSDPHHAAYVIVTGMDFSTLAIVPDEDTLTVFLPDAKFVWTAICGGVAGSTTAPA